MIGTKRPYSRKKVPRVHIRNGVSLKIVKSGSTLPPGLGGRRERIRRFAAASRAMKMNPSTLLDQAQPIWG